MPTLDWIGKKAVLNHHKEVPYHLLECDKKLSVGDPGSGNLLVQGDNLLALKALLPYYAGKVKCIYIDPPYNTGNENWVYNDAVNSPEMQEWLGKVVGKEAEDLSRHDKWLCMMYPRLQLLKQFLQEDGVIFVSIDDNEVGYLRILLDEIFSQKNFIANLIWQKKYTRANDAKYFSDNHDHILCYARNKPKFKIGKIERTDTQNKAYKNPDKHPLGAWKPTPLHAKSGSNTSTYKFKNGVVWKPPNGTFRRFTDTTLSRFDENGEIWFGKKGDAVPQRKTFLGSLDEGVTPVTFWAHEIAGDNHIARDEIKTILHGLNVLFDNPKPSDLLKLILQLATKKDSIVMDSFSGSGTMGQAVLALNKEDGGSRKFLLVEMDEGICRDVTRQRLSRVIQGYKNETNGRKIEIPPLGGGLQFCKLGYSLFNETGQIQEDVKYADLASHVYFSETGEPLPKRSTGKTPLLGIHHDTAIYLLYNGILKDKSPNGGNALTRSVLEQLPPHDGSKVIFGVSCRLGQAHLKRKQIIFRQIPYELKVD